MRIYAAIALLVACNNADPRIEKMEGRVGLMEAELDRLGSNDEALRKTFVGEAGNVFERFFRAGLVDKDNANITRWWCIDDGDAACERTSARCEDTRVWVQKSAKREVAPCGARRVAFCGGVQGVNCFGSYELCRDATAPLLRDPSANARPCIGVE